MAEFLEALAQQRIVLELGSVSPTVLASRAMSGSGIACAKLGLRITPRGSRPSLMRIQRLEEAVAHQRDAEVARTRLSRVRSAMAPCPTQATKSWLMTWLVIQPPSRP